MNDPVPGATPAHARTPSTLVGWRLLALFYDLLPAVAMWFAMAFLFALAYNLTGHAPHQNIAPFSALQWLLWCVCWLITGLYAVVSWRRGGQTLGMRPWRLRVIGTDGHAATSHALWLRYTIGTLSLLTGGLGFWWAFFDRERLTWHDRASGTRLLRDPKRG